MGIRENKHHSGLKDFMTYELTCNWPLTSGEQAGHWLRVQLNEENVPTQLIHELTQSIQASTITKCLSQ